MLERFSTDARDAVVAAQQEARRLRHNYVGTEHLLLGLLHAEDSPAAKVLATFGVLPGQVRLEVNRIVGRGEEVTTGQIPFTPRAKHVLELASREMRTLRNDQLGAEHILLGLLRENEGLASRILAEFGATPTRAAEQAVTTLDLSAPEGYAASFALTPPPPPRPPGRPPRVRQPHTRDEIDRRPALLTVAGLFAGALALGLLLAWLAWG